jgi:hypothetical protein
MIMKEIVQFKDSDRELIEAFKKLREDADKVYDMWKTRLDEIQMCWHEHRNEIIEDLGGMETEEWDCTDAFYSSFMNMVNGISNYRSLSHSNYDFYLKYIKPINELIEEQRRRFEEKKKQ